MIYSIPWNEEVVITISLPASAYIAPPSLEQLLRLCLAQTREGFCKAPEITQNEMGIYKVLQQ